MQVLSKDRFQNWRPARPPRNHFLPLPWMTRENNKADKELHSSICDRNRMNRDSEEQDYIQEVVKVAFLTQINCCRSSGKKLKKITIGSKPVKIHHSNISVVSWFRLLKKVNEWRNIVRHQRRFLEPPLIYSKWCKVLHNWQQRKPLKSSISEEMQRNYSWCRKVNSREEGQHNCGSSPFNWLGQNGVESSRLLCCHSKQSVRYVCIIFCRFADEFTNEAHAVVG